MKKLIPILVASTLFFVIFAIGVTSPRAEELPKIITFTSYKVGTLGYIMSSGLREAIEKLTPMKVRVEPYGTDMARIMPLRTKESEISISTGATGTCASYGLAEFGVKNWGPQPIRQVWKGVSLKVSLLTRANSGIKTAMDLKGKRIPKVPGWPTGMLCVEGVMAFGNVTWDDVTAVPLSGYTEQIQAVLQKKSDVGWTATVVPPAKELAAGPHGAAWVVLPHADKQGWKRLHAKAPWIVPAVVKKGPGIPEGGMELGSYPYSIWAYDHIDDDIIYNVVKAIDKGYDIFKDMHKALPAFKLKAAVDSPSPVPYHDGAIRYFKEAGVWTAELDKWQAQQLKAFEERKAKFKKK